MSELDRPSGDRDTHERERKHSSRKHSRSPSRHRHHRSRSRSRHGRHRSRTPRRSSTPSPTRSPAPEKKKSSAWDVTPPGLQGINIQALAAINPAIIAPLLAPQNPQATRQARRLYIGNIPPGSTEEMLKEFFNRLMAERGLTTLPAPTPVVEVQLNSEKGFAFIELRTIEEASNGMSLDGIAFNGNALRVKRPKDYTPLPAGTMDSISSIGGPVIAGVNLGISRVQPSPIPVKKGAATSGPSAVGAPAGGLPTPVPTVLPGMRPSISSTVADSPNKIFVGGLPSYLTDDHIKELLGTIGPLKSFNLVRDSATGNSKGYAFFEYLDPNLTEPACQGLHGTKLGDKTLIVQRASVGAKKRQEPQANLLTGAIDPATLSKLTVGGPNAVTCASSSILMLLNLCTLEDTEDQEDEDEIIRDIREECQRFGTVRQVILHKPPKDDEQPLPGTATPPRPSTEEPEKPRLLGKLCKIFVAFETPEQTRAAAQALSGRRYQSRTVVSAFYPEELFEQKRFPD